MRKLIAIFMMSWSTTVASTQFQAQIAASSDDAEVSGGTIYLTSSPIWVGHYSANPGDSTMGAFRFRSVTIDPGSTIDSAWMVLTEQNGFIPTTRSILVYGEDADDAGTFSTYSDYLTRPRTSAHSTWTTASGTVYADSAYRTPDIKSVIQEIIDRGGWANGNDIALQLADSSTGASSNWRFYAYNGSTSKAAIVNIWYTTGGSPPAATDDFTHRHSPANIGIRHRVSGVGMRHKP